MGGSVRSIWRLRALLLLSLGTLTAGCDLPSGEEADAYAHIGPAGGSVNGPDGAAVEIPPGALDRTVTVRVARADGRAPSIPAGLSLIGRVYAFTPHGLSFAEPALVRVPAGSGGRLYTAAPAGTWEPIAFAEREGLLEAEVDHFSYFAVLAGEASDGGGTASDGGTSTDGGTGSDAGVAEDGGSAVPPTIVEVDVGNSLVCARADTGALYCWGADSELFAGHDAGPLCGTTFCFERPQLIGWFPDGVTDIAMAGTHSCAVVPPHGSVSCWGRDDIGQLGRGDTATRREAPGAVPGLTGVTQVDVSEECNFLECNHTCALKGDGTIWCWGSNVRGQLGTGIHGDFASSPVRVPGLTNMVKVVTGAMFTCGMMDTGEVLCWGDGNRRQLGFATTETCGGGISCATSPQAVSGIPIAEDLVAGHGHVCIVGQDGQVWCWGSNHASQLADPSASTLRGEPVPVADIITAQRIWGDVHSTCVDTWGGETLCWGRNADGELGDGTRTDRAVPTGHADPHAWDQMAVGGFEYTVGISACGVDDGEVFCWGDNTNGQLGDGTLTDRLSPGRVLW